MDLYQIRRQVYEVQRYIGIIRRLQYDIQRLGGLQGIFEAQTALQRLGGAGTLVKKLDAAQITLDRFAGTERTLTRMEQLLPVLSSLGGLMAMMTTVFAYVNIFFFWIGVILMLAKSFEDQRKEQERIRKLLEKQAERQEIVESVIKEMEAKRRASYRAVVPG